MNFQYAIFDMDGTLLDSIPYWDRLVPEFLEELGVQAAETAELNKQMASMSIREACVWLKKEFGFVQEAEEIDQELCRRIQVNYAFDIERKPGVKEGLSWLKQQGVRMCVATASSVQLGRPALERNGLLPYFDFLADCRMAGAGKTSPAVYQLAAERFDARASQCVVVEDSAFALKTAKRAGFLTIGVYEKAEPDQEAVRSYSDLYVKKLTDLKSCGLLRLSVI